MNQLKTNFYIIVPGISHWDDHVKYNVDGVPDPKKWFIRLFKYIYIYIHTVYCGYTILNK